LSNLNKENIQLTFFQYISAVYFRHRRSQLFDFFDFPKIFKTFEQDPNRAHGRRDHQLHLGRRAEVLGHDPLPLHHLGDSLSSLPGIHLSLPGAWSFSIGRIGKEERFKNL